MLSNTELKNPPPPPNKTNKTKTKKTATITSDHQVLISTWAPHGFLAFTKKGFKNSLK